MVNARLFTVNIVKVQLESGERLPMLLDSQGLPVVPVNEWVLSRKHKSLNTLSNNVQELTPLYVWLESRGEDLFGLIRSGRFWTEAFTSSLIEYLRRGQRKGKKVAKLAVRPDTFNKRLSTALNFLKWCFYSVLSDQELGGTRREAISKVQERLIYTLKDGYHSKEPSNSEVKKGITAAQARFLQDVLDPESTMLVSSPQTKLRNYLIVSLMLLLGLRPGEVLSLRLSDIEFGALTNVRVRRRKICAEDTRSCPASVKRAGRILVLDYPRLEKLLNSYVMHAREIAVRRANGKSNDFLFLSRDGKPLSESSVQAIFKRVRTAYPEKLPGNLSAKSMRHSFTNGLRRELKFQGRSDDEIRAILMYLRGDTGRESQDTYIDYQGQSAEAQKSYWLTVAGSRGAEDVPF